MSPSPSTASAQPSPSSSSAASETSSPASTPSESPSPEPTQEPTPEPTSAETTEPAAPVAAGGTNCGLSNTGGTTLVLAEGSASCDEVKQVFADFNAQFNNSTDTVNINGYQCHSYSPESTDQEGRTVSCTQGSTRLEAMTSYPLGGIPVAEGTVHSDEKGVYFKVGKLMCEVHEAGPGCMRPSADGRGGGVLEFIGFDRTTGAPGIEQSGGGVGPNPLYDGKQLPAGQVVTAYGSACKFDGTYLECQNPSGRGFKVNDTEFIPQN